MVLSTAAWIAIGVTIGVVVVAAIVLIIVFTLPKKKTSSSSFSASISSGSQASSSFVPPECTVDPCLPENGVSMAFKTGEGAYLEAGDSDVSLEPPSGLANQAWIMNVLSSANNDDTGVYKIINSNSTKALTNIDGAITAEDDTGDPTQIWTYIRTGAGFEDDQKFMITMDGKALTWPELSMEDIDHSNPNQEWEIVIFPE